MADTAAAASSDAPQLTSSGGKASHAAEGPDGKPVKASSKKKGGTDGGATVGGSGSGGGGGFATRGNYFTVDDLVWVRPPRHPFWPAEIVEVLDAAGTRFRCKLFSPPAPEHAEIVAHGQTLFFFDRLESENDVLKVIEDRLQRDKHNVTAYEGAFVVAVREANALARVVFNPDTAWADPRFHLAVKPVGIVHCFHRTHTAAPRQPHTGEVAAPALGVIRLARGFENAVRDLKGFERIWVTFQFSYAMAHTDDDAARGFSYMVVPPRDTVARGVFATRSPHRPNSLGLSCVRLVDVRGLDVHIADHDLLHGTPVLDIKPYLPFCDAHPTARAGWVDALNASGKARGDHRVVDAPDVAIVRNYPQGVRPTRVDPATGQPTGSAAKNTNAEQASPSASAAAEEEEQR